MNAIKISNKKEATVILLEKTYDTVCDLYDFGFPKIKMPTDDAVAMLASYTNPWTICKNVSLRGIRYEIENEAFEDALTCLQSYKMVRIDESDTNDLSGYIIAGDIHEIKEKIEHFKSRGVSLDNILKKSKNSVKEDASTRLGFDKESGVLFFQGKEILISKSKNTKPYYLLEVIFKDKEKSWEYMDISDELGGNDYTKDDWKKFWQAGNTINKKIATKTATEDFLKITKNTVGINKKYLFNR